jgi:hypothetical protein
MLQMEIGGIDHSELPLEYALKNGVERGARGTQRGAPGAVALTRFADPIPVPGDGVTFQQKSDQEPLPEIPEEEAVPTPPWANRRASGSRAGNRKRSKAKKGAKKKAGKKGKGKNFRSRGRGRGGGRR